MLVFCAALWGLGFVAMKEALDAYPTFWILFFRFGLATLLMGVLFLRRIRQARRRDLIGGAAIGCFLFLGMGIQTLGLNYTTAGKQAFLTASYVVMVPFLAWGTRKIFPGWTAMLGAVICFSGMGLLISDAAGPLNVGDVLTVVSALFFAMQIIAIASFAAEGDPLVLTFTQFFVTALLSLAAAPLAGSPLVFQGGRGVPEILFAALFCTFLCFLIQNVAQKYTTSTHASILLGLESVFGVLSGIVLLGETFTLRMGVGCALIFGAVLLVELVPAWLKNGRCLPQE
ncbi:MAG: DMT family transporter [Synergistaceae bacterium]|jgi:drug/metabolite transporter (DMT)-like permease|nr:DMT family transporter [Synergistaceae bacterium]